MQYLHPRLDKTWKETVPTAQEDDEYQHHLVTLAKKINERPSDFNSVTRLVEILKNSAAGCTEEENFKLACKMLAATCMQHPGVAVRTPDVKAAIDQHLTDLEQFYIVTLGGQPKTLVQMRVENLIAEHDSLLSQNDQLYLEIAALEKQLLEKKQKIEENESVMQKLNAQIQDSKKQINTALDRAFKATQERLLKFKSLL